MPKIITRESTNGKPDDSMVREALKLYDRGFWVVPVKPVNKAAIWKEWQKRKRSREELEEVLQGTKYNIAIVLNQSDYIDIECDSEDAESALLVMFDGEIPDTPTWRSRRGLHRLFRRPDGLPEKAVIELLGIEFHIGNGGRGSNSVVPPSKHIDGPVYEWLPGLSLDDVDPAELPECVAARLRTDRRPAKPPVEGKIAEGERNNKLFVLACGLRDSGISRDAVEAALLAENEARCEPPLPADEVRAIARSAMEAVPDRDPGNREAPTKADKLLAIVNPILDPWHAPDGTGCVSIPVNGHSEHWPVRSRQFKNWLSRAWFESTNGAISASALADVMGVIESRAIFDGPEHPLCMRVSDLDGSIYIDLADEAWRAIEVDETGWRVVDAPPVRFRRAKGMLSLPEPVPGGSVEELRRFLDLSDTYWPLVTAWLVASFRGSGPFPVLKLLGEQGSGKSTRARALRALIDPNSASARRPPKSERDLMIAANNAWIVSFDNLSFIPPDLSDAMCCLATGGGFATRTLYENDTETIFNSMRPQIVNGIEDVGTRSDLLDRALVVELPRIEPEKRRAEKQYWAEFDEAKPRILGAILDAVSAGLRELPAVEKREIEWPRMADFAAWAVATETALGSKPGTFLECYDANRASANLTALESSPVVVALFAMLRKDGKFEGTADELWRKLTTWQNEKTKGWPKSPRPLAGLLARLAPNLRKAGISIEHDREKNRKLWRIAAVDLDNLPSPGASANPQSSQLSPSKNLREGRNGKATSGVGAALREKTGRDRP